MAKSNKPQIVTVDANLLVPSFPRYLFLRLHERRICKVVCSDRIWDETKGILGDPKLGEKCLSATEIAKIRGHIEAANILEYVLDTKKHKKAIDRLEYINEKDRHVLYLAYISNSKYLVTEDMDFRSETVHHDEGLDFYFPVEAVSFDSFLCTTVAR